MKGFAAALSEADMKNVAAFYATQEGQARLRQGQGTGRAGREDLPRRHRRPPGRRPAPAATAPTAPASRRSTRACRGQHADYTEAQLVAFRDGARNNSPQMTAIAAKLNDREIKAVADYIAGLR